MLNQDSGNKELIFIKTPTSKKTQKNAKISKYSSIKS